MVPACRAAGGRRTAGGSAFATWLRAALTAGRQGVLYRAGRIRPVPDTTEIALGWRPAAKRAEAVGDVEDAEGGRVRLLGADEHRALGLVLPQEAVPQVRSDNPGLVGAAAEVCRRVPLSSTLQPSMLPAKSL
jgi:hypothetical protein